MFKEGYYYKKDNDWLKCIHVNAGFFPSAILENTEKQQIKVTSEMFDSFVENQYPDDLKEDGVYFVAVDMLNKNDTVLADSKKALMVELGDKKDNYLIIQGIKI